MILLTPLGLFNCTTCFGQPLEVWAQEVCLLLKTHNTCLVGGGGIGMSVTSFPVSFLPTFPSQVIKLTCGIPMQWQVCQHSHSQSDNNRNSWLRRREDCKGSAGKSREQPKRGVTVQVDRQASIDICGWLKRPAQYLLDVHS